MDARISQQRNIDIVNVFYDKLKALRNSIGCNQETIIKEVVNSKAPRFYTSYEVCRRYVSLIERGKPVNITNSNKLDMYKELHRRYKIAKEKYKCDGYLILERIIEEEAPSFYIDGQTFKSILYKAHKKRNR